LAWPIEGDGRRGGAPWSKTRSASAVPTSPTRTHAYQLTLMMLTMDPPRHTALRSLVSEGGLGANLARVEAAAIFPEVLSRMKDLELAGPVERLSSTLMNGIRSMPVRFNTAAVAGR
jgi:cytochrome P450